MGHVIWDWNGTLFNDLHLLVEATSVALAAIGEAPIDTAAYRRNHHRPLTSFYEQLLGREVSDQEWLAVNDGFVNAYASMLHRADLATDALLALQKLEGAGYTQSLLSMWLHDQLLPLVDDVGITDYFVRIDGHLASTGESKADSLVRHLDALETALRFRLDLDEITMIGDTVDDGETALGAGVNCVLVSTGAQRTEELQVVGWPVADSLSAAIELVLAGPLAAS